MVIEDYLKLSKEERLGCIEELYDRLIIANDRSETSNVKVAVVVLISLIKVADINNDIK